MARPSHEELSRVAIEAALAGGREALARFRDPGLAAHTKADGSPVTEGDLAAEKAALAILKARRPDDLILSEESGELPGDPRRRWTLDPVDGTRSYCRGIASWATLVACIEDGEPVAGAIHAPALDQLAVAWKGGGAWLNGRPIHVSDRARIDEATLSIGSLDLLPSLPWGERAFQLMGRAFACRGGGDPDPRGGRPLRHAQRRADVRGRKRARVERARARRDPARPASVIEKKETPRCARGDGALPG